MKFYAYLELQFAFFSSSSKWFLFTTYLIILPSAVAEFIEFLPSPAFSARKCNEREIFFSTTLDLIHPSTGNKINDLNFVFDQVIST